MDLRPLLVGLAYSHPTQKDNDLVNPKNNVELDVESIVTNNPEDQLRSFVSDDDHIHKDFEDTTIVSPINCVNTKKFEKKKKKEDKNKFYFKPTKTSTKKVSTLTKAKRLTKKKEILRKRQKSVAFTDRPNCKKKLTLKRKVVPIMEIVEDDVADILVNIVVSPVKMKINIFRGKKILTNIWLLRRTKFRYIMKKAS